MFETIVALATAPLKSALSIVRLSGDDCFFVVNKIFSKDLTKYTKNSIIHGRIIDGTETDTTYNNVVGVIFDVDGAGMEIIQNKVTKEYVGSEDFTNYFHHMSIRNFVDTRLSSIVLELT